MHWRRKAARRLAQPVASRPVARRGPPRRVRRRRRRSSWSTRLARRSARWWALATRRPRRRGRGPRHDCQGTGWRPGKPRGNGRVTGRSRAPRAHRTARTRDHHAATAHESQNAFPDLASNPDEDDRSEDYPRLLKICRTDTRHGCDEHRHRFQLVEIKSKYHKTVYIYG